MPLRIKGLTYPTQISSYYQILEEHRESVNDMEYMYIFKTMLSVALQARNGYFLLKNSSIAI
jgi:hypothetical protein